MFLIIGLGNPGKEYLDTRHNIGFKIINEFAKQDDFPKFELFKKANSLISQKNSISKKIILSKPQTFMNDSGRSVISLMNFYKLSSKDIIIIHDDIDLLLEKIKVSKNRGSAGHKGVKSIIQQLGTKDFIRIRIGIKPTETKKEKDTKKFVLEKFTKEEKLKLKEIIKKAIQEIKILI